MFINKKTEGKKSRDTVPLSTEHTGDGYHVDKIQNTNSNISFSRNTIQYWLIWRYIIIRQRD